MAMKYGTLARGQESDDLVPQQICQKLGHLPSGDTERLIFNCNGQIFPHMRYKCHMLDINARPGLSV
jgi:hypothetical protein